MRFGLTNVILLAWSWALLGVYFLFLPGDQLFAAPRSVAQLRHLIGDKYTPLWQTKDKASVLSFRYLLLGRYIHLSQTSAGLVSAWVRAESGPLSRKLSCSLFPSFHLSLSESVWTLSSPRLSFHRLVSTAFCFIATSQGFYEVSNTNTFSPSADIKCRLSCWWSETCFCSALQGKNIDCSVKMGFAHPQLHSVPIVNQE